MRIQGTIQGMQYNQRIINNKKYGMHFCRPYFLLIFIKRLLSTTFRDNKTKNNVKMFYGCIKVQSYAKSKGIL